MPTAQFLNTDSVLREGDREAGRGWLHSHVAPKVRKGCCASDLPQDIEDARRQMGSGQI